MDFVKGELVQLKSGGPIMIVEVINGDLLKCRWYTNDDRFNLSESHLGEFHFATLIRAEV